MTNKDQQPPRGHTQAESVTRALLTSLKGLETVRNVPPEECLEGMLKAAGVYAVDRLGNIEEAAQAFEDLAHALRNLAPANLQPITQGPCHGAD